MVCSGLIVALLSTVITLSAFAAPTAGLVSSLSSTLFSTTSGLMGISKQKSPGSASFPQVMRGPAGSAVGIECFCNKASKCTITLSGGITDILGNGADYKGNLTISGWIQDGHAWASTDSYGQAAAPFTLKCNAIGDVCSTTMAGNLTQVFDNGEAMELWGWLTPSGKCDKGVCTGEIKALGDPGY
ncbi:uncharacterized protein MYCGRDRAFT_94396 [Zymoseptoria tritici IPO323]|uniref:Uncharacterized protein n=1 Tax=Zymoseptoria tritici (strain CBS 115943 / IPO323) TaxID=336722 RepID=F9XFE1_ZYMTI|nr:uncharacterized protein MYCGRDRAFT_94396 [Zymoseptoria tritici IPO323]EGP85640.1 hypothetical protein MYCGRDRAFT_94396 [Zymoseptoria tritici IPO323]